MKQVSIHVAPNQIEANIIKGFLESEGIKAKAIPSDEGVPIGGDVPVGGTMMQALPWIVYVSEADAVKAQELLKEKKFQSVSPTNIFPFPLKKNFRPATRWILRIVAIIFLVYLALFVFTALFR